MREPQFVSSAYFLRFRFEKGHYALAGRDKIDDLDALKIEYYPETGLFKDGRTKPDKKVRDKEDEIEEKMNKVSMVTLWVDPKTLPDPAVHLRRHRHGLLPGPRAGPGR